MTFEEAFYWLKDGSASRAYRRGWSKGVFIYIKFASPGDEVTRPFVIVDTLQSANPNPDYEKGRAPYVPNQCDLFSNDWELLQ